MLLTVFFNEWRLIRVLKVDFLVRIYWNSLEWSSQRLKILKFDRRSLWKTVFVIWFLIFINHLNGCGFKRDVLTTLTTTWLCRGECTRAIPLPRLARQGPPQDARCPSSAGGAGAAGTGCREASSALSSTTAPATSVATSGHRRAGCGDRGTASTASTDSRATGRASRPAWPSAKTESTAPHRTDRGPRPCTVSKTKSVLRIRGSWSDYERCNGGIYVMFGLFCMWLTDSRATARGNWTKCTYKFLSRPFLNFKKIYNIVYCIPMRKILVVIIILLEYIYHLVII